MKKTPKTIFFLSFAPAVMLLIKSLISLLIGGVPAFEDSIIFGSLVLCVIPILPLCLIYQILYLCKRFLPAFKKLRLKHLVAIGAAILAVFAAIFAQDFIRCLIESALDKHEAQKFYSAADFRIDYNTNVTTAGGLFGISEQETSCILLDIDSSRIAFIVNSDLDCFYQYKLTEAQAGDSALKQIKDTYYVQQVFPIQSAEREIGRVITFYDEKPYSHRTVAVIIEYDSGAGGDLSGRVFYADSLQDDDGDSPVYLALNWQSKYLSSEIKYADID